MIDFHTDHLALPLPNVGNSLAEDEPRLETALAIIDAWAATTDTAVTGAAAAATTAATAAATASSAAAAAATTAAGAVTVNTTQAGQITALNATVAAQATTLATHTTNITTLQGQATSFASTLGGLGNAAVKNVGSTAGTVAAGDHTHAGFQTTLGYVPANQAGDTFTGPMGVNSASGRQAWVGAGDLSSSGAGSGDILLGANIYYDRATAQYKASANGTVGYRGLRMTQTLGLEYADTGAGASATSAGVALASPAWSSVWHSGNAQVGANALARRMSGSGDTLVLAVNVPYRSDTSGGAFAVTLPGAPTAGDWVLMIDETGSWPTNPLTIHSGGAKINGVVQDLVCDVAHAVVRLYWPHDAGSGWKVQ